jgi:hypothetical protein
VLVAASVCVIPDNLFLVVDAVGGAVDGPGKVDIGVAAATVEETMRVAENVSVNPDPSPLALMSRGSVALLPGGSIIV